MTIVNQTSSIQYAGDDNATTFSFPFLLPDEVNLVVTLTDSGGTDTVLVLDTDYSISGVGVEGDGEVTYPISGSPLATGETLTIERSIPRTQETDFSSQGTFRAQAHEDAIDKLTMMVQDVARSTGATSVSGPGSSTNGNLASWSGTAGTTLADSGYSPASFSATGHTHTGVYALASHAHAATDITSGTLDGDRLPGLSTTKAGGVPATGSPSGKFLKDDGTWSTPTAGAGDVVGPGSSTDNAIARFDSTTGKLLQNGLATVSDTGGINIPTGQTFDVNGSPHAHAESAITFTDITTNNASTTKHGYMPKFPNTGGTTYLKDDGTWGAPAGGAHTQNTDSGTTGADFTVDSDSTTGKVKIAATAGASNFTQTITNSALTADRTATLPDATGTVVLADTAQTLTNKTIDSLTNTVSADRIHRKVYAGEAIAKGDLVYVSAWNVANSCPEVKKAKANATSTMPAVGMADAAISNGTTGEIYMVGIVSGMDTSAFSSGNTVYVSAATAGAMTATRPTGPNIEQKVAVIGKQDATTGTLSLLMGSTKEFSAADKFWYGGTAGVVTEGTVTSAARTVLDDTTVAAMRATLGVVDGSDNMQLPILLPADKRASSTIKTLTDGATVTPDMATGNIFSLTLGGNRTLANPTNMVAGQTFVLFAIQDATGSRTLSYGSYWNFAGDTAPTLSTAANAVDVIAGVVRSTTAIDCVLSIKGSA